MKIRGKMFLLIKLGMDYFFSKQRSHNDTCSFTTLKYLFISLHLADVSIFDNLTKVKMKYFYMSVCFYKRTIDDMEERHETSF